MIKSQILPIGLSLLAAFCGAFAQFLYKHAALQFTDVPIYKNYSLFLGLLSFTLVLILFIFAFRTGGKIFVVYPAYATTYIWVALIGVFWDKETLSLLQILGGLAIMLGVSLIAMGTKA